MKAHVRQRLLGVGCVLVTLLVGTTGGPTAAATLREDPGGAAIPVFVGTYNIRAGVSLDAFRSALNETLPHVDVLGMQEINSKEKAAVMAAVPGWDYFRPPRFYGEQRPVMWNQSVFTEVSARVERIGEETNIGNEIPGKSGYIKPQYAVVVRLIHNVTGRRVSVVNLHLLPGAVKAGRPWPDRPKLFAYYAETLARAIEVVKAESAWGTTWALGDYNAGWVADERNRKPRLPFMRFRNIGMRSMWASERPELGIGTHRDALIDQVFSAGWAHRTQVLTNVTYSDHHPAVAVFDMASAG